MNSLQRRLQWGLALSLILLMAAMWVVGNRSVRALTEEFIASRLEHDAESVLAALVLGTDSEAFRPGRLAEVYRRPLSGHYYLILFPDGRQLVSRSLWDHALSLPQLSPGESLRMRLEGPAGQELLVLVQGLRKQGRELTLAVAEDLTPMREQRDQFKRNFALLAIGGLALLLLVQGWVVRRSFRRLEPLREDIRRLGQGKTEQLTEDVPTEILPLVQEFNQLLRLLNQRLERSRNALGNLAHALKGPLSILIQYLDRQAEDRDELVQARAQAERIRQLMERELKRARMAGKGVPRRRFDPAEDLPDLIMVLRQLHSERKLDLRWQVADEIRPFGEREDLLELLGNLLDNACKWAKSKVVCRIAGSEAVTIVLEDDGVGISDQDLARLTERGGRLDETVEGHGLGLAIAKDIVKLYGGTMSFSRSPELGGLQVEIRLPQPGETAMT
jgi:signal transduction histidine kinase